MSPSSIPKWEVAPSKTCFGSGQRLRNLLRLLQLLWGCGGEGWGGGGSRVVEEGGCLGNRFAPQGPWPLAGSRGCTGAEAGRAAQWARPPAVIAVGAGRRRRQPARAAGGSGPGPGPGRAPTSPSRPAGGAPERLLLFGEEAESLLLVFLAKAGVRARDGGQGQALCLDADALGFVDGGAHAL